jgi:hypothetical protein
MASFKMDCVGDEPVGQHLLEMWRHGTLSMVAHAPLRASLNFFTRLRETSSVIGPEVPSGPRSPRVMSMSSEERAMAPNTLDREVQPLAYLLP